MLQKKAILFISKYHKAAFVLVVLLNIAMSIGIEQLTDRGVKGAEALLIRSSVNFLLALAVAAIGRQSLLPAQPRLQMGVFLSLGLSLLLTFTAYEHISAGSVNALQRLDIPLLAVVAVVSHSRSRRKPFLSSVPGSGFDQRTVSFWLSVLAFVLVAVLLLFNQTTDEEPAGYFLMLAAVGALVITTLLRQKTARSENIATIMLIASLSSMFWGGIRCWQIHASFAGVSPAVLCFIVVLALINFVMFFLVNEFHKKYPPEFVRYPYLIAAFGTMIAEMITEHKLFSPLLIGCNMALLLVAYLLVKRAGK